jgi:predicted nucleic acid-binding Zn ribbon protein
MENIEKNIKNLRESGWGYKRIARKLNLSRDEVRDISKQLNLAGYRGGEPVKKERKPEPIRYCVFCGKLLDSSKIHPGPASKYCSPQCRREQDKATKRLRRSERRDIMKTCPGCGNTFATYSPDITYCSHRCANRRRRGAHGYFMRNN